MENLPDSQQQESQQLVDLLDSQQPNQEQDSQPLLLESQQQESQEVEVEVDVKFTSEDETTSEEEESQSQFDENAVFDKIEEKLMDGDHSLCLDVVECLIPFIDEKLTVDQLLVNITRCQKGQSTLNRATRLKLAQNNMTTSHIKSFIYSVKLKQNYKKIYLQNRLKKNYGDIIKRKKKIKIKT